MPTRSSWRDAWHRCHWLRRPPCSTAVRRRGSTAGAGRPVVRLTLDERDRARARRNSQSPRGAARRAQRRRPSAADGRRATAAATAAGCAARRLHAHQSRRRVRIAQPGQPPQVIYPDVPDNYRARLDLQWPIYTGGRVDALERAARAERDATGEDLAAARADLRLEITRAFWALVTARETEQVRRALAREHRRARAATCAARLDQGLHPAERRAVRRSAAVAPAVLAIEARNTSARSRKRICGGCSASTAPRPHRAGRRARQPPVRRVVRDGPRWSRRRARSGPSGGRSRIAPSVARARDAAAAAAARPQVGVDGGYDYARPEPAHLSAHRRDGRTPGTCRSTSAGRCGTAAAAAPSRPRRRAGVARGRGARARTSIARSPSRCGSAGSSSTRAARRSPPRPTASARHRSAPRRRRALQRRRRDEHRRARRARSRVLQARARSHARARQRPARRGAARAGGRQVTRTVGSASGSRDGNAEPGAGRTMSDRHRSRGT